MFITRQFNIQYSQTFAGLYILLKSVLKKIKFIARIIWCQQIKENGLKSENITFSEGSIRKIIREYTREAGVRSLEREIASVCRKVARQVVEDPSTSVNVSASMIEKYLGTARYRYGVAEADNQVGVATGLAWTEAGGDILSIEVALLKGKGNLTLTGKLGDVMKESAQAALTYVRSRAEELKIEDEIYQKSDVHLHVPEGAIPKDGPSAGITIAIALASAMSGIPVRNDVAMTGEITLRGRVLPIGGLKEVLRLYSGTCGNNGWITAGSKVRQCENK